MEHLVDDDDRREAGVVCLHAREGLLAHRDVGAPGAGSGRDVSPAQRGTFRPSRKTSFERYSPAPMPRSSRTSERSWPAAVRKSESTSPHSGLRSFSAARAAAFATRARAVIRSVASRPPRGRPAAAGAEIARAANDATAARLVTRWRPSAWQEGRSAPSFESFRIHAGKLPSRPDNRGASFMRLRFGEVTFDPEARLLLRGPDPVHLTTKAFDLLALLLKERPRALSREELMDAIWPDVLVTESNLTSLVNDVRSAIGDDAKHPAFVRTHHGFGYSFAAEVVLGAVRRPGVRGGVRAWLVWGLNVLDLSEGENVLGRDPAAGIWICDPSVSRHHARIVVRGGDATLEDLGSKNGSFHARPAASMAQSLCTTARRNQDRLDRPRLPGASVSALDSDGELKALAAQERRIQEETKNFARTLLRWRRIFHLQRRTQVPRRNDVRSGMEGNMNRAFGRSRTSLVLVALAFLAAACNETKTPTEPVTFVSPTPAPTPVPQSASMFGTIETYGPPLADAIVGCQGRSTITSSNGAYSLTGLMSGRTIVTVQPPNVTYLTEFAVELKPGSNTVNLSFY